MFITITGELGSGKSTIAKLMYQEYGFEVYSTGSIQREIAKEKGITTLELNQLMSNDINNIYDKMIDEKTVELSQKSEGKNIVFDSRMAWHFVKNALKVYVTVDPYVAANRVIMAGRGKEEQYQTIEEATRSLLKRKELEDSRFAEIYFVNTTDFNNYDLIIDSTSISASDLAEIIVKKAKSDNKKQEIYLSSQRLFPTHTIRDINPNYVKELEIDFNDTPIEVVEFNRAYYIIDGHHRACCMIQNGQKLIPVIILKVNSEGYIEKYNRKIEEIVKISRKDYYDWEDFNSIRFLGYPN